jgi:uncharacterized protein with ParB-like and HNH nuclease domain
MTRSTDATSYTCLVNTLRIREWVDSRDFDGGTLPPLLVPEFQRYYEWPRVMVTDFTTRLFSTYLRNKDKPKGQREVFFASTVFLHLKKDAVDETVFDDSKCRALILDGQQRLVTLSLIILVLLDRLKKLTSDKKDKKIVKMTESLTKYLVFEKDGDKYPCITLREDQNDVSLFARIFKLNQFSHSHLFRLGLNFC